MRLVTWNLRFDAQPDNISVEKTLASLSDPLEPPPFMKLNHERPWSARRIPVVQQILNEGVIIVGLQEALIRQVNDLQELLGPQWGWVGVGRDNGNLAGEFNPIFYDKRNLSLVSNETFWLSATPFVPSKYPGAGSYRIANVATFRLTEDSSKTFTFINTHLDERSEDQRKLGASLLLYRCRYAAATTLAPVFVVGDFNSEQSGKEGGAYRILTGADPPVKIPDDFKAKYACEDYKETFTMNDLRSSTPRIGVMGFFRTFTGFNQALGEANFARIDYVLGGSNGGWKSNLYNTTSTVTDDGLMASDHRPVFVDVDLE